MKKNVLFAGLGNMGYPMARNLKSKSLFNVYGYDKIPSLVTKAAEEFSLDHHTSINYRDIDCVISIVPDTNDLKNFYVNDGIFKECKEGTLLIDCSTIGNKNATEINKMVRDNGMVFVDAPVCGGVMKAATGKLSFLVGADNETIFSKAKDYLQYMAENVFDCKKVGNGQTVKVVNNMGIAIQMRSVIEMMMLGESLDIDAKTLANILVHCTSNCWALDTTNPVPNAVSTSPSNNDYEGGFKTKLMLKDVKLALDDAINKGINLKFAELIAQDFERVVEAGYGDKDFGYLYQLLSKTQNMNTTLK